MSHLICAKLDREDEESIELLESMDYQLDQTMSLLRVLEGVEWFWVLRSGCWYDGRRRVFDELVSIDLGLYVKMEDKRLGCSICPVRSRGNAAAPLKTRISSTACIVDGRRSLLVEHDGALSLAPEAEDEAWDNEPQLELVVPSATPGVLAKDIGIVLLTTHIPIDRDGHSQPALVHIFPPSPYLPVRRSAVCRV
ncbi:hypothetical protein EYR36_002334 [Pleurotus pulmonarius]|nr:hypothetical protein EYR36_002334 [Pleurotus pulmonarius]